MSTYQESAAEPGRQAVRPPGRRRRRLLAGGLVAGTLVAGAAGLSAAVATTGDGADRAAPVLVGADEARVDHRAEGDRPDGKWGDRARSAREVPCDPSALVTAVLHANAEGGGELTLAEGCTYTLTSYEDRPVPPRPEAEPPAVAPDHRSGLPAIYHPITIHGRGATIVRGEHAKQFRFFIVRNGGVLHLTDLTLAGGNAGSGGAIWIDEGGTAVAERLTVTDSTARDAAGGGGAIFSDGHLTIADSKFIDNRAAGASGAGGAVLNGGVLVMSGTEFRGNDARGVGGGLANIRGAADVQQSVFVANTAIEGGGVASASARTKVATSRVTGNLAATGAGLSNRDATLTLRDLTVEGNESVGDGGGVSTVQGLLTVDDSTIEANTAPGAGGGIYAERSNLVVRYSKVAHNRADGRYSVGGGIVVRYGQASLFRSRVVDNKSTRAPGGLAVEQARVEVDDETVIVGNRPTNCRTDQATVGNCFA
jgi:hypothetical protein